jgi:succinate-semialdehyde dehydrogenase / glutarate-semialdehyde dehydrogenase
MATLLVSDKWTGECIGELPYAGEHEVEAAFAAAQGARRDPWPALERADALHTARRLLAERRDAILEVMQRETGFTRLDVQDEFKRALVTLRLCAEEATRLSGEVVPLGASPGFEERVAFTIRVPAGVVLAITPFNAPLNTVCHKVGPALAAGNSVILKPAAFTPLTAQALTEVLWAAGVPPERLHILYGAGSDLGLRLLRDPRVDFTTFTGSTDVGIVVKRETGIRPVQLELGSVSVTVVCEDANLAQVATDVQRAGYRKAGQVCTSVQVLFVHESVHARLLDALSEKVLELPAGDPRADQTRVGPLICEPAAERAQQLVQRATSAGARVVVGGPAVGSLFAPSLVADVRPDMDLARQEIFAPVVATVPYADASAALGQINAGRYGLQAGVYTERIATALSWARGLEVGGVIINGTSSTRADGMPYGGVKDSGFGREGPAYAVQEMTTSRLIMWGGSAS